MAASAFTLYSNAILEMTKGNFNLSSDTYVATLHTASYSPAPNTQALWSDVSASELTTVNGYTQGGVVLTTTTDTLSTATVTFSAASVVWSGFSAGPFRYVIITRRASTSLVTGDLILCYSDLTGGGTITGSGGTFTITMSGSGIFQITHTP